VILLIDNYDSFVHNLARYFRRLGQTTSVVRNDAVTVEEVQRARPQAIVLSPGPCTPNEAGCSLELVRQLGDRFPILGICLGHQTIAQALGAKVIRADEPVHGRTSLIEHDGRGVFAGQPDEIEVSRYHSLVVDEATLPESLEISARTTSGMIMALRHRELPLVGLQFHPESILTESGFPLLAGFLRTAGIDLPSELPTTEYERPEPLPAQELPERPVTF